jgi:ABC-type transport system involved in multi-copper enzyme maturation permease subunit
VNQESNFILSSRTGAYRTGAYRTGALRTMALARKEIFSYLNTPAFYGAAVFFLAFCSIWLFYFQRYFVMNSATLRPYFGTFPLVFILVIPTLTMKSWAEERKTGSIEMLLTCLFPNGTLFWENSFPFTPY